IVEPIANFVFTELRAGGNENPAQLGDRQGRDVKLRQVREPKKNPVAGLYTQLSKRAGTTVTGGIKLSVGEGSVLSGGVFPVEGRVVAVTLVHLTLRESHAEVELCWNEIPRLPIPPERIVIHDRPPAFNWLTYITRVRQSCSVILCP